MTQPNNQDVVPSEASDDYDERKDVVDRTSGPPQYPADIGTSATSHGDGTHTIAPDLIKRREEMRLASLREAEALEQES